MSLTIKDPITEKLVRELAALTGEGVTEAIRHATEERLGRVKRARGRRSVAQDLLDIGVHCAGLPDLDIRTPEEVLGYDEHGLPR